MTTKLHQYSSVQLKIGLGVKLNKRDNLPVCKKVNRKRTIHKSQEAYRLEKSRWDSNSLHSKDLHTNPTHGDPDKQKHLALISSIIVFQKSRVSSLILDLWTIPDSMKSL